jgi:Cdc6-like AAA superfamily ATPase
LTNFCEVNAATWIIPFKRNQRFTGREDVLSDVEEKLSVNGPTTKIALWGLGGVGKTQVLLELVHRARYRDPNLSVIWIPTTSMENVNQAFLETARKLHIPGSEDDKCNAKALVQQHLSQESAGHWLLVFDNADDVNMWFLKRQEGQKVDRLVDYLPKSEKGHIIFTTRDRKIARRLCNQSPHNLVEILQMDKSSAH